LWYESGRPHRRRAKLYRLLPAHAMFGCQDTIAIVEVRMSGRPAIMQFHRTIIPHGFPDAGRHAAADMCGLPDIGDRPALRVAGIPVCVIHGDSISRNRAAAVSCY